MSLQSIQWEWESDHEQTPALGDTPEHDMWSTKLTRNTQQHIEYTLDAEELRENRMDWM